MKRIFFVGMSTLLLAAAVLPISKAYAQNGMTNQPNGDLPDMESTDEYRPEMDRQNPPGMDNQNSSDDQYRNNQDNPNSSDYRYRNDQYDRQSSRQMESYDPTGYTTLPNGDLPDIEATDEYRPQLDRSRVISQRSDDVSDRRSNSPEQTGQTTLPNGDLPDIEATDEYRPQPDAPQQNR